MRKIAIIILMLFVGVYSCQQNEEVIKEKTEKECVDSHKDGLFVHISSNDARKSLMGLSIALKMQGAKDVIVFIDSEGINLTVKDGDTHQMDGFDGTTVELMQKLSAAGVKIMACPMCLKSFGKTKDDLREGIEIAQAENFFGFTKGRILTLDY